MAPNLNDVQADLNLIFDTKDLDCDSLIR